MLPTYRDDLETRNWERWAEPQGSVQRPPLLFQSAAPKNRGLHSSGSIASPLHCGDGITMNSKQKRALLVLGVTGMLTFGLAGAASAAETSATVTVTGGALSMTVPVNAGNLGTRANSVAGGTISGQLGEVQV